MRSVRLLPVLTSSSSFVTARSGQATRRTPRHRCDAEVAGDSGDLWKELSPLLREEIMRWNAEYQMIIPLDSHARVSMSGVIEDLDTRGLDLAARVEAELAPAKVKYYSEGLLKYRI